MLSRLIWLLPCRILKDCLKVKLAVWMQYQRVTSNRIFDQSFNRLKLQIWKIRRYSKKYSMREKGLYQENLSDINNFIYELKRQQLLMISIRALSIIIGWS